MIVNIVAVLLLGLILVATIAQQVEQLFLIQKVIGSVSDSSGHILTYLWVEHFCPMSSVSVYEFVHVCEWLHLVLALRAFSGQHD